MVFSVPEHLPSQRLSVPAAPDGDHARIITKSGDVNAEHDRADLILASAADGVGHQVRADELQVAGTRKDTPDANEVAVLAIILDPSSDLGLVGQLGVPAVDLAGDATIRNLPKKASRVASGIAKYEME